MTKLLLPEKDDVFQNLFGKIGNETITQRLISLVINRPIEKLTLDVSNRLEREDVTKKSGLLDVRAKLQSGEDFNIEMQRADYKDITERILYYWSRLYGRKLNKSEEYKKLKPTISILITKYKLEETKGIEQYHTIWNLREKHKSNKILTSNMEIHVLELAKVKEEYIEEDELALWLMFIKNPNNERVREKMKVNEVLKQAMERLEQVCREQTMEELREEMALRDQISYIKQMQEEGLEKGIKQGKKLGIQQGMKQGIQQGLQQGMKQGMEQGEKVGKEKIIKEMLKKNFEVKAISDVTGYTVEEIQKIG